MRVPRPHLEPQNQVFRGNPEIYTFGELGVLWKLRGVKAAALIPTPNSRLRRWELGLFRRPSAVRAGVEKRPLTDCRLCGGPAHRSAGPGEPVPARAITEGFPLEVNVSGNGGREGIFKCPSSCRGGLQKGGCSHLKGGGHRGGERGWGVCSTAGLIPDALLGCAGSCLLSACCPGGPRTGGRGREPWPPLSSSSSPVPCLLSPPAGSYSRPSFEQRWSKARNSEASSSSIADPLPSTR